MADNDEIVIDPSVMDSISKERKRLQDEVYQLNAEKDQMENEAKAPYVVFLSTNSKGNYSPEDLQKLPLEVLKKLKANFADSVNTGYNQILEERELQRKKDKAAKLGSDGIGVYNRKTGKYEGGLLGDEE